MKTGFVAKDAKQLRRLIFTRTDGICSMSQVAGVSYGVIAEAVNVPGKVFQPKSAKKIAAALGVDVFDIFEFAT